MSYTIRADRDGEIITETRKSPASAVVLAMRWKDLGFKQIVILAASGRSHEIKSAQERLKKGLRL